MYSSTRSALDVAYPTNIPLVLPLRANPGKAFADRLKSDTSSAVSGSAADESNDADPLQQDPGDVEEDICPLGCDMAIYEALLELRQAGPPGRIVSNLLVNNESRGFY